MYNDGTLDGISRRRDPHSGWINLVNSSEHRLLRQLVVFSDLLFGRHFDFESEMYNVHTVDSWSEYLDCVSLDSYLEDHVHDDGPALITLEDEPGFKRFICPMLDYCSQGMKLQLEALSSCQPAGDSEVNSFATYVEYHMRLWIFQQESTEYNWFPSHTRSCNVRLNASLNSNLTSDDMLEIR
ncbi:hypothetical protein LXL04_012804 [Taraxacum kok-saghyz]